jgi:hypothetical protein
VSAEAISPRGSAIGSSAGAECRCNRRASAASTRATVVSLWALPTHLTTPALRSTLSSPKLTSPPLPPLSFYLTHVNHVGWENARAANFHHVLEGRAELIERNFKVPVRRRAGEKAESAAQHAGKTVEVSTQTTRKNRQMSWRASGGSGPPYKHKGDQHTRKK